MIPPKGFGSKGTGGKGDRFGQLVIINDSLRAQPK